MTSNDTAAQQPPSAKATPRDSLTEFTIWDGLAHEAATTMMLLHLYGYLELPKEPSDSDFDSFDDRIGREPDQYDLEAGCWRLIFEAGIEVIQIRDLDPKHDQQIGAGLEQYRAYLCSTGTPKKIAAKVTPDIYRRLIKRRTNIRRYQQMYGKLFTEIRCAPDPAVTIPELLRDGYTVETATQDTGHPSYSNPILVIEETTPEQWLIYSPTQGLYAQPLTPKFFALLRPSLLAYRPTR